MFLLVVWHRVHAMRARTPTENTLYCTEDAGLFTLLSPPRPICFSL